MLLDLKRPQALNHKALVKRINYQLSSNFFTLAELQSYSLRQVKKVIKLIAKLEQIKLTRAEVKAIALYLQSNLTQSTPAAAKLWSFVSYFKPKAKVLVKRIFSLFELVALPAYWANRFELMRN